MIKLKNILLEIGEGSAKPYKWKADHKTKMAFGMDVTDYEYVWETDSGLQYVLTINTVPVEGIGYWNAAFGPYKLVGIAEIKLFCPFIIISFNFAPDCQIHR